MTDLVRFKTATLTDIGFHRNGVFNEATAFQKIEHLGLLFGALAASPRSVVKGYGVTTEKLAMGLLVFPAVLDWYVQWRERHRGFYTVRSEEHTSELQSLMRISYAVFCLKKKKQKQPIINTSIQTY